MISRGCDLSIADNKNRSALHWAAQLGRVDFVQGLIRGEGVDVNFRDNSGATPLHYASAAGTTLNHSSVIQILLDNGASVDSEDSECNTALIWAAAKGATFAIVRVTTGPIII